jgi:23S rRNA (pseudouridine1915-N3)-methyltransferase
MLAIGVRMPYWIKAGYAEYAGRLPREFALNLVEIPAGKRSVKADSMHNLREEGSRLLAAVPPGSKLIALNERGLQWSTVEFSEQIRVCLREGRDLSLLIGGPRGLDTTCCDRADLLWALSPLTFPHLLVRVLVAEQVYRVWSLLNNHPYHRE